MHMADQDQSTEQAERDEILHGNATRAVGTFLRAALRPVILGSIHKTILVRYVAACAASASIHHKTK